MTDTPQVILMERKLRGRWVFFAVCTDDAVAELIEKYFNKFEFRTQPVPVFSHIFPDGVMI